MRQRTLQHKVLSIRRFPATNFTISLSRTFWGHAGPLREERDSIAHHAYAHAWGRSMTTTIKDMSSKRWAPSGHVGGNRQQEEEKETYLN